MTASTTLKTAVFGADAEGQREHCHRREAGRTAEKTERVAKVMKEHDTRGAKIVPGDYAATIPIITLGYGSSAGRLWDWHVPQAHSVSFLNVRTFRRAVSADATCRPLRLQTQ